MRSIVSSLTLLAAAFAAPALAHATSYDNFVVTSDNRTVSFTLPTGVAVTPFANVYTGGGYAISYTVSTTINTGGVITVDPTDTVTFYNSNAGGGWTDNEQDAPYPFPVLFFQNADGTLPTGNILNFLLGSVTRTDSTGKTGTAVITAATGATTTPEPSSLILLGTGALGLAGAARRRFANR